MGLIAWDEKFNTGITSIDRQHEQLVGLINRLDDAMQLASDHNVIGEILDELEQYVITHFRTEETYFERYNYPPAAEHKKEHLAFEENIQRLKEDFEDSKLGMSVDVMNFLAQWLKNHILGTDLQFSAFFKQRGVN